MATSELSRIWADGEAQRNGRQAERNKPPLIRLWDGNFNYRGTVRDALETKFQWKLNDTGTGYIKLPADSYLAQWALNHWERPTKNVHVTMDKDGARWGGRMSEAKLVKSNDGTHHVELTFLHDYEELKHIYVWPNPVSPIVVQFPRTFIMLGPVRWALKVALLLNVWRLEGAAWTLPDDPLDITQWGAEFDPSKWAIQVNPTELKYDTSPFVVLSSRMKTWHDLAKDKLAESHLMVTCRRWLTGDPLPWENAKVHHGCLCVDIVDKSGFWNPDGTALYGDLGTGLVRTIQSLTGDVELENKVMDNPNNLTTKEYWEKKDWLGTKPTAPYVVYRDGHLTGITSAEYSYSPATCVQVVTGGHSAYGVNETISSAITLVGNWLGIFLGFTSIGSVADVFLKPLYEDTILAWNRIKSHERASHNPTGKLPSQALGWAHYHEHFADGADRAFTINAAMALRKGFFDTREKISHKLDIRDGSPWFVGENGKGHFFLGDRVGATVEGLPPTMIIVEQVTELVYETKRTDRGWSITLGDLNQQHTTGELFMSKIRELTTTVHDLGVI